MRHDSAIRPAACEEYETLLKNSGAALAEWKKGRLESSAFCKPTSPKRTPLCKPTRAIAKCASCLRSCIPALGSIPSPPVIDCISRALHA
jgi:hypothetical protein